MCIDGFRSVGSILRRIRCLGPALAGAPHEGRPPSAVVVDDTPGGVSQRRWTMRPMKGIFLAVAAMLLAIGPALADEYSDTTNLFKNAGESAAFFGNSYAYVVFPTIGKAGLGVGGAHGSGRAYEQGKYVGDAKMTQLSVGLQAGGQAFSEMIFFQDKRSFDDFKSGNFDFGANASAVVITAAASGSASGSGSSASASAGKKDAKTAGEYRKGSAVFVISKGGLMYEASISGQKFSYTPVGSK